MSCGPRRAINYRKNQSQRRLLQRWERLACFLAPAVGRGVRQEDRREVIRTARDLDRACMQRSRVRSRQGRVGGGLSAEGWRHAMRASEHPSGGASRLSHAALHRSRERLLCPRGERRAAGKRAQWHAETGLAADKERMGSHAQRTSVGFPLAVLAFAADACESLSLSRSQRLH